MSATGTRPQARIAAGGERRASIWESSAHVRELYRARARDEAQELTCHAQAAELLAVRARPGESVLDAGCGTGALYHALRRRGVDVEYHGIDASHTFVGIGREELARFGLPPGRLQAIRLEDLDAEVDHAVCLNVLSNLDNVHRGLERLLRAARRTVILRESLGPEARSTYVRDAFLDPGVDLRVHVNTYAIEEVAALCDHHGFRAEVVVDRWTGGEPELVIGHPHRWTFLVAERR